MLKYSREMTSDFRSDFRLYASFLGHTLAFDLSIFGLYLMPITMTMSTVDSRTGLGIIMTIAAMYTGNALSLEHESAGRLHFLMRHCTGAILTGGILIEALALVPAMTFGA
jgi:hypothetical protein